MSCGCDHNRDCDRIRGLRCCHNENPFTGKFRICCDRDFDDCRRFREEDRDCFWPDFTHPRWLRCRILFGCRNRDEKHEEHEEHEHEEHEEREHHHHCCH